MSRRKGGSMGKLSIEERIENVLDKLETSLTDKERAVQLELLELLRSMQ